MSGSEFIGEQTTTLCVYICVPLIIYQFVRPVPEAQPSFLKLSTHQSVTIPDRDRQDTHALWIAGRYRSVTI